MLLSKGDRIS